MEKEGAYKYFKLSSSVTTSNMVLFDRDGMMKKYSDVEEILKDFFYVRLGVYHQRKEFLKDKLSKELMKLSNKVRFILAVIKDEMKIRNVKKADIFKQLVKDKYDPIPKKSAAKKVDEEEEEEEESGAEEEASAATSMSDFDYLLSMPLWSLTMEKVEALKAEKVLLACFRLFVSASCFLCDGVPNSLLLFYVVVVVDDVDINRSETLLKASSTRLASGLSESPAVNS